ncbi:hypothetical protein V1477_002730 [Vespula maculifrons]|uniref:Uncharacterized protein n=1 Tax=Vespula maculifrons TaxID=7453 RepID=A0ABD2CVK0_VESMC
MLINKIDEKSDPLELVKDGTYHNSHYYSQWNSSERSGTVYYNVSSSKEAAKSRILCNISMLLKMKVWNIFNMTKTPYESGEFLTG